MNKAEGRTSGIRLPLFLSMPRHIRACHRPEIAGGGKANAFLEFLEGGKGKVCEVLCRSVSCKGACGGIGILPDEKYLQCLHVNSLVSEAKIAGEVIGSVCRISCCLLCQQGLQFCFERDEFRFKA